MSENLFQPMYVFWTSFIVLLVIWSWKGWKNWHSDRVPAQKLKKYRRFTFYSTEQAAAYFPGLQKGIRDTGYEKHI